MSVLCNGSYLYTCGNILYSSSNNTRDIVLVKWDADGNDMWNRTLGGPNNDYGNSLCGDGTYIYTCGKTNSYGAGGEDLFLVKWDTDGNVVWNRTWGGSNSEIGRFIIRNGSFIYTTGNTNSFGVAGSSDLLLVKWDLDGNQVWNRTWGGSSYESDYGLANNLNFIYMIGVTSSYDAGGFDILLLKSDIAISDANGTYDTDGDGLTDDEEINIYSTDPNNNDTDSDGLADGQEILTYNTNATNNDTDSDGLSDGDEILVHSTNATNNDTDSDGLSDGDEILTYSTDATNDDSDTDGLTDGQEILTYNSNATNNDTDSDGLSDGDEILIYFTNATNNDTDGDVYSDLEEINAGTDPNDANVYPQEKSDTGPSTNPYLIPILVVVFIGIGAGVGIGLFFLFGVKRKKS